MYLRQSATFSISCTAGDYFVLKLDKLMGSILRDSGHKIASNSANMIPEPTKMNSSNKGELKEG